jgi:hypothetical protein
MRSCSCHRLIHLIPQPRTERGANRRSAAAVDNDPIFAAIAKFGAADERWLNSLADGKDRDAAWDALGHAEIHMMWNTKPTTIAGMVARLDFIHQIPQSCSVLGRRLRRKPRAGE